MLTLEAVLILQEKSIEVMKKHSIENTFSFFHKLPCGSTLSSSFSLIAQKYSP